MTKISSISPIFQNFVLPAQSDNQTEKSGNAYIGHDEKKSHGSSITLSLIGVALAAFIFMKGFGGGFDKKMSKIIDSLQAKIFTKTLMETRHDFVNKGLINLQKSLVWLFNSLQSISNVSPIKDTLTMKLFRLSSPTITLAEKINKVFRKIAISSSRHAYEKAFTSFDELCGYLKSLFPEKNGRMDKLVAEVEAAYQANFLASAKHERLKEIKVMTQNLEETLVEALYNKKDGALRNPGRFKGYITFDLIAKEKFEFHQRLLKFRRQITNTNYHENTELSSAINGIKAHINTNDMIAVDLISSIQSQFGKYKKTLHGDNKIIQREIALKIVNNLDKLNAHCINFIHGSKEYSNKTLNILTSHITSMKNVLQNDKQAFLQQGLDLVESKYGRGSKEYKKAQKKVIDFSKKFDIAVEREGVGLLEKIAEIQVGSAPADVLGLLIPAIAAIVWTAKAEGKDEKVATALQTSIPIVGGIATALYGTTRMYTGVQNLTLAIVSGAILSLIGTGLNKSYRATIADKNTKNTATA